MLVPKRRSSLQLLLASLMAIIPSSCKIGEKRPFFSGLSALGSDSELVSGSYTVKSAGSGKCLDVPNSTLMNNAILGQFTCNNTNAQLWTFTKIDGGFVTITNVGNGKALDLMNSSMVDGGRLVQQPASAYQPTQQWSIIGTGGQLGIRSRMSGKVLELVDMSMNDGAQVQQWADSAAPHQRWILSLVRGQPVATQDATAPASTTTPPASTTPPTTTPTQGGTTMGAVTISGRQILVGGVPFSIKGVCYNPIRKGQTHPAGLLFVNPAAADLATIEKDFTMMQAAGINTIRTYEPILDDKVLALVTKYQLRVIVPLLNYYQETAERAGDLVNKLKSHPSTLIWELGNEWNYNHLYGDANFTVESTKALLLSAATLVKGLDKTHPLSTVYGELPPQDLINQFSNIDVWGINIYSGLTFGDRFSKWKALSGKPMYIGEFGADAINVDKLDVNSQGVATAALINEISQNLSSKNPANVAMGSSIFEWNDEWWKDGKGSPSVQEIGGIAPGSGPYPDNIFNEEYWGIVDIDRNPRPAYQKLKEGYVKY